MNLYADEPTGKLTFQSHTYSKVNILSVNRFIRPLHVFGGGTSSSPLTMTQKWQEVMICEISQKALGKNSILSLKVNLRREY